MRARSARPGGDRRRITPDRKPVEVRSAPRPAAPPKVRQVVEGRDPRETPAVGDVVQDERSEVIVVRVADPVPGEPAGWAWVEGARRAWRGQPKRAPEWRAWTLSSWRANMVDADVLGREEPGGR